MRSPRIGQDLATEQQQNWLFPRDGGGLSLSLSPVRKFLFFLKKSQNGITYGK